MYEIDIMKQLKEKKIRSLWDKENKILYISTIDIIDTTTNNKNYWLPIKMATEELEKPNTHSKKIINQKIKER